MPTVRWVSLTATMQLVTGLCKVISFPSNVVEQKNILVKSMNLVN